MFTRIARFDVRFRWLIVAVWIAATAAAVFTLPSLSSVTQSNDAQFLSSSIPSVQAAAPPSALAAGPTAGPSPTATEGGRS